MGLNDFDKLIKDNQEYFEKEASSEHMDKFFFKLQESQNKNQIYKSNRNNHTSWWVGIAASLVLLFSIGWFITQYQVTNDHQQTASLNTELLNIKNYYNQNSQKLLKEINQCADQSKTTKKLINTTETQLSKLSFNSEKLESKLKDSQGNKKLEKAFIQSLKTQNDLINQMHTEICKQSNNLLTQ